MLDQHNNLEDPTEGRAGGKPTGTRRIGILAARSLLPIIVLIVATVGYQALKASKPEAAKRPPQEKVWAVRALPVEFGDYQPMLRLFGETVAGRVVELRSLVAGEVERTEIGLREGAVVAKGDLLLTIAPFDFEGAIVEAEARLNEATARLAELNASFKLEQDALANDREALKLARRDLERAEPLSKKGTVSQKVVDDRRLVVTQRTQTVEQRGNNLKVWAAKADQQRAILSRLEWGVRRARHELDETKLRAPFTAYVGEVNAEQGRMLGVNDRVATLFDRNWLDVKFTLTDHQYGRIASGGGTLEGREVKILWRVGNDPLAYSARVERIGSRIESQTGGVSIYARIDDPLKPIPLRPGAFVEILLPDQKYTDVARLPRSSIYGGDKVYVLKDGRLEERKVRIVGADNSDVLVAGKISTGERVMQTHLSAPSTGLKVTER